MFTSQNFFQKHRFPLPNFVNSRISVNKNKKLTTNTEMFLKRNLKSELYTTDFPSKSGPQQCVWVINFETNSQTLYRVVFKQFRLV